MRISDWSSDVCSSDLGTSRHRASLRRSERKAEHQQGEKAPGRPCQGGKPGPKDDKYGKRLAWPKTIGKLAGRYLKQSVTERKCGDHPPELGVAQLELRSEEHTSELQSLMRISYAVFCLKKKKHYNRLHIMTE